MRYLKKYKVFEALQSQEHWDIHDILLELFDEFNYEVPEFVTKYPNQYNIQAGSIKWGQIDISDYWAFGAKCLRIRITDNSNRLLKKGAYKDFNGFYEVGTEKYKSILQEAHQRIIQILEPVEVIVGSIGYYTTDLDILYFYEKPTFERLGDVEIYGSNIGIKLDKLNITLESNSRHQNMFSAYSTNIMGSVMVSLMGYYDGYFYNQDILKVMNSDTPIEKWVQSEWDNVCKKLKIKDGQKVNMDNPKITVAEFMSLLKKNQDNYESN
jgi:hypothetical protein